MEENTKTKQPRDLDEEQLQAITGSTGDRIQNFAGIDKTYDEHMLIQQHWKEGKQALSDAENYITADMRDKSGRSYKDAKMHFDMITHISNNIIKGR